jgi:Domain of unknown function (DUF397)
MTNWRKSKDSFANGNCVEVTDEVTDGVLVRNSKDRNGVVLRFSSGTWRLFIRQLK